MIRFRIIAAAAVFAALVLQLNVSSAAVSAAPDQVGEWSTPVGWPLVAVHMSLEPNGQVLAWDGGSFGPDSERLWDPATGTFLPVGYGRNLFCAGHVGLADGRTLILGGHVSNNHGLADTTIFDATTNTWFRGPDMAVGRWYPTATLLPDGRTLVFAGDNIVVDREGVPPPFKDASEDSLPEIYNPKTNSFTQLSSSRLTTPLYPYMFVLSDGRIFEAGPDTVSRVLTPGSWTWSTVATSPFDGMSAVMYGPDKIMKAGSWADPDFGGARLYDAHGRTAVIDLSKPSPAWRETAPMHFGRAYHNLTLLADGTVLASGGGSTSDGVDLTKSVLPAEIWNPDTETWTQVASLQDGRLYHSTALLLQDGRVLMAGGGRVPNASATEQKSAEIYSPPYLFKGPRPTITNAPTTIAYGSTFTVATPDAARIAKVSLIRTPSVTHAFDQNQRYLPVSFTAGAGRLTVTAPANARLAPPGDYMLFIVDGNGVPSVASIVRAVAPADANPPTVSITAPGAGIVSGTINVTADAADDTDVQSVQFRLDGQDLGDTDPIAPYSVSWDTTTAANGNHSLTATATDGSGNTTTSAPVAVTVTNSFLVAAYSLDEGSGPAVADASGNGNGGVVSGAAWTAAGKNGGALSFDGVNDSVTVADSASLDLTGGMTLEAWVKPSLVGPSWQTVVLKELPGGLDYALYAHTSNAGPSVHISSGGNEPRARSASEIAAGAWTHLAGTYDGSTLRLYVNGTLAVSQAAAGSIATSGGALRIGGNNVWSEWFQGLIDDVRVYDRALTANEIQTDMKTPVGDATPPPPPLDTAPPTQPGALTATAGSSNATLSWSASTDNTAVAHYNLHRSQTPGFTPTAANRIAQPSGSPYTDPNLPAGTYYYRVTAEDAAGNTSLPSNEAGVTITTPPPPPQAGGLVAAYGFEEGAGTDVPDRSGNANNGLISGATWTTNGKYGNALDFDGSNDWVTIDDSQSVDLTGEMTLEAWIKPSTLSGSWRTVLLKEEPGGLAYALYAHTSSQGPSVHISTGGAEPRARSQTAVTAGVWTHLAGTYDGSTLRLYVNGELALSQAATGAIATSAGALRIGGNNVWSEWFQGLIDDVRVYDRALTATEIQTDMQTPVGDAAPPPSDTTPPSVAITAPAAGTTVSGTVSVSAGASDEIGVRGVQFTLDGQTYGAEDTTAPYVLDWDTRIFANGPHSLGAIARDAAGNRTTSLAVPVTVDNAAPPPPSTTGLVAAYGFGEGGGTSVGDASGSSNNGSISGAAWTSGGKHGSALSFDGVDDWVTVNDSQSLHVEGPITVSAWVMPTSGGGSSWQTVALKEGSGELDYALYASATAGLPSGHASVGGSDERTNGSSALSLDTWSYLAMTYDGNQLRLYRDGVEVASKPLEGEIATGTGALRIGGNAVWTEWFHGVIDDVRIYDRALTPAELQFDMSRGVTP